MPDGFWKRLFCGSACAHQWVLVERGGMNQLQGKLYVCKTCGQMTYGK